MYSVFRFMAWTVVLVVVAQFVVVAARAQEAKPKAMDVAEAVRLVEGYFNGMGTYQARFEQRTTGEQWTQEGMFYLNRPKGQFLWNYESPDRQRLIATGTKLYFVDDEQGGAATELPVKSGLSRLFTGKKLELAKEGLKATAAWQTPLQVEIVLETVGAKEGADMGGMQGMKLTFDREPLALVKAEVVDAVDAVTTVQLADIKQGVVMDGRMFKYTPRLSNP